MDVPSVEVVVDASLSVRILGWVFVGCALGTISGSIPGLHANNFALILAGAASAIPGPPLLVGVAVLSAGVVHTFLNAVPAMALGVPDPEMAVTALPGHRLVLEGRGREAVRLSALGSVIAVVAAVPLAIPVTMAVTAVYPTLRAHLSVVLALIVVGLIATERTWRARGVALCTFGLTTGLGGLTLDLAPDAPLESGGTLAPLFAGLFGAPVLIDAIRGGGVPPQTDATVTTPPKTVATTAVAGALAGAVVGYVPGVSAAIAAVGVLFVVPSGGDAGAEIGASSGGPGPGGIGPGGPDPADVATDGTGTVERGGGFRNGNDVDIDGDGGIESGVGSGDRAYIVATSGVDTANTIFALFALVAIGQPRTGVMVAVESANVPLELPILVAAVVLAGVAGFGLVLSVGDRYLEVVGRLTYWKLSAAILGLLAVIAVLFAGPLGVAILAAAAAIGMVPIRLQCRRVHLMGVLIGPLALGL